jgi:Mrp family chromosome partitioning ATPase
MFDAMKRAEDERRNKAERPANDVSNNEYVSYRQRRPATSQTATAPAVDAEKNPLIRELGILRNSIEVALAGKKKRSILFTSAMGGEGTTMIATSFAKTLVLQGQERILVCEMNARRPRFADVFSTNGDAGITEYFAGGKGLASLIQRSPVEGLDVLHVGHQDATIIQLHLNQIFPKFLEEALRNYDTMIIDAPPVIDYPETPPMTAYVDGVVMVLHAGKTKSETALRAMESIGNFKGNLLGVVLNRKKYYIPGFIYRRV